MWFGRLPLQPDRSCNVSLRELFELDPAQPLFRVFTGSRVRLRQLAGSVGFSPELPKSAFFEDATVGGYHDSQH